MSSEAPIRVLFVCMGNICRSPLAEGVFRHLVAEAGLEERFEIDSAGTIGYHAGDPPDPRTTAVARRRGIELTGASRRIRREDLHRFDHVLVMDSDNLEAVQALADGATHGADIRLLREYDPEADGTDVPDPYYDGADGFERVHDIVESACRGLLAQLRHEHGI